MWSECTGSNFFAMTKVPLHTKAVTNKHVFIASAPGECISVNQLLSTQVGFIAQLNRETHHTEVHCSDHVVDHLSSVWYVYLMLSSEETIQAKQAFEQFASHHSVAEFDTPGNEEAQYEPSLQILPQVCKMRKYVTISTLLLLQVPPFLYQLVLALEGGQENFDKLWRN